MMSATSSCIVPSSVISPESTLSRTYQPEVEVRVETVEKYSLYRYTPLSARVLFRCVVVTEVPCVSF